MPNAHPDEAHTEHDLDDLDGSAPAGVAQGVRTPAMNATAN
ncbi:MAG TPA: hypothetical protein VN636_00995 [Acidimicrobiia bacterium]|nr:hypothetical protein [Acidimicrobiia bacterium]